MNDHVLSFLSAYQGTLAQALPLPDTLTVDYALYDCLRETSDKSTYLLKKKTDASFAILKVAKNGAREHLRAEYSILSSLRSAQIPQALSYFSEQNADYFLRSYVAGVSVSSQVERNGVFTETETARLVCGLCETLSLLHAQTPPVIHRDIKPENIIYTKEHTLALIDFDAARHFQPAQKRDTVYLGTQATAAPEQFGYQQTDARSDIYSTGVLLLFLCTGKYELDALAQIHSHTLRHVIETCTRFDPQRRYKTIRALSRDLARAQRVVDPHAVSFWRGAALGLFAGVALSLALVFSGMLTARAQEEASATATPESKSLQAALPAEDQAIVFESPEIERAVREQLGVNEATPLVQADLDRVDKLFLCGPYTKTNWSEAIDFSLYLSNYQYGEVASVADIPKLRNLTELALVNQKISDITPLAGMRLTRLSLNGNLIIDPSPLSSLTFLRELYIGFNPLTQIEMVKNLPLLQAIDLSSTSVSDLSPLSNDMTRICLNDAPILDYSPLLKMNTLQELYISHPNQSCLNILAQLQDLTRLEVEDGPASIEPVLCLANLTHIALGPTQLNSIEGIQTLNHLSYFRICAAADLDLTPLTKTKNLETLDIYNQEMKDYSAIFQIPNLKHLYCKEAQRDGIEALGLPITFEIHVV